MSRAIAAALLLVASIAHAEHGATIHLDEPVLLNAWLCDTEEQVVSVIETHRDSGLLAATALLRSYHQTMGEHDEPVCVFVEAQPLVVERVVIAEKLLDPLGNEFLGCAVKILTVPGKPLIWGLLAGVHVEPARVREQTPGGRGEIKGAGHVPARFVAPPGPV